MKVHLYTTDASGLRLVEHFPAGLSLDAVIVPENRIGSEKVRRLREQARAPLIVQPRGGDLPDRQRIADIAVVWMYSQILPPETLGRYLHGMINMHGGRIPHYRGANVLHWAIINGESSLGVTWHGLVAEVDAGPIWHESEIPIAPHDTALDVRAHMIAEALRTFPLAFARMLGKQPPVRVPDLSQGHVWPSRRPRDGLFPAGWPEQRVRNLIRALCEPWPPARYAAATGEISIRDIAAREEPGTIPYETAEGTILHLQPAPSA